MKTLKKIGVLSAGFALAIAYFVAGLLWGLMTYLQIKGMDAATIASDATLSAVANVGAWIIVISPIVGVIMGLIVGLIVALVYNYIIVKIMGGIKLELV